MAMLPFCGYHMGDYWQHWLDMGEKLGDTACPRSSTSTGSAPTTNGDFIWPGFGENLRVVEWILKRCFDEADARETEIGYLPKVEDINLDGIDVDPDTLAGLLSVDRDLWKQETEGIHEFYAKFGDKLPKALAEELAGLEERLKD